MFTEDLNVFFDGLDSFEAVFETCPQRRVTCYFDNSFLDATVGETLMDTTAPRLTARWEDVKDIPRETLVWVKERQFSVRQIQPEGTGLATIALAYERQPEDNGAWY